MLTTIVDLDEAVLEAAAWALNDRPPYSSETPVYDRVTERFIAPARARLGTHASERAAVTGRALSLDDALALAFGPPVGTRGAAHAV